MMPATSLSRRAFFRGRSVKVTNAMRLPWSGEREHFLSACTACGDCIDHCPEGIIIKGEGRYPAIDFNKGECTFCEDCVNACKTGALSLEYTPPFRHPIVIQSGCFANQNIFCRSCGEICPQEAIHFPLQAGSMQPPRVDTDACDGCGACIGPCPANAIEIQEQKSTHAMQ